MQLAVQSILLREPRLRRIGELLIALWLLSLADLCFTLWAHRFTPFIELNPLAGAMLGKNLILSVVIYKITLMLFATAVFWRARSSGRTEFALWGLVLVYTLLMFRWSTYTAEASQQVSLSSHWEPAAVVKS